MKGSPTRFALAGLLLASVVACNPPGAPSQNRNQNQTQTTTTTTVPPPTLNRVNLSGSVPLSEIGSTAQLTAVAVYSDASTKDVTQEANWTSQDPSVVTVAAGLVRVVAF